MEMFKALSKAILHNACGKWGEVGSGAVETLSAIGLSTDPGELAFIIIRRSITEALLDLVGKIASQQLIETENNSGKLVTT